MYSIYMDLEGIFISYILAVYAYTTINYMEPFGKLPKLDNAEGDVIPMEAFRTLNCRGLNGFQNHLEAYLRYTIP